MIKRKIIFFAILIFANMSYADQTVLCPPADFLQKNASDLIVYSVNDIGPPETNIISPKLYLINHYFWMIKINLSGHINKEESISTAQAYAHKYFLEYTKTTRTVDGSYYCTDFWHSPYAVVKTYSPFQIVGQDYFPPEKITCVKDKSNALMCEGYDKTHFMITGMNSSTSPAGEYTFSYGTWYYDLSNNSMEFETWKNGHVTFAYTNPAAEEPIDLSAIFGSDYFHYRTIANIEDSNWHLVKEADNRSLYRCEKQNQCPVNQIQGD